MSWRDLLRRGRWTDKAVPVLVLGLGYSAISRAVASSWPFNHMSMFDDSRGSASHIAVRLVDSGELTEVWAFDHWSCDEPIEFSRNGVPAGGDGIARNFMLAEVGQPSHPVAVEVVRRTYRLASNRAPLETLEQVLLHCRAERRARPHRW